MIQSEPRAHGFQFTAASTVADKNASELYPTVAKNRACL